MTTFRSSLSRKLTAMNMLVSGGALLLASMAFFTFDLITFRTNIIHNLSIQAEIIGSNTVTPLIFNDPKSAENTLSALRYASHIDYAGVYTADGQFFAGYWRGQRAEPLALPPFAVDQGENYRFGSGNFELEQTIAFQNKPVGIVYIRTDLGALYDRLKTYGLILIVILGASLIAALALSRIFQRVISSPILSLAETARAVSRDRDYSVRATESQDHDEVAALVTAFNEMLLEIQTRNGALQESERQFRTLADSIPQLAWMAAPDGSRIWFNQRWYEYTGASPEQVLGSGWESLHDPDFLPREKEKWAVCMRTGELFEMIYPLRGADGEFRYFLTLAVPVLDAQGKIVRWFGTNTDVTEQRRSEEALRQTEKLAATGRLAASIAHEINNPLESVTNLIYLSRKQPANMDRYLQSAEQELDRISQITKNTLGFYRDSASPTTANVSEILEEVVALYTRKIRFKNISVDLNYGERIEIAGYPGELRQIFANLVANAIEALPEAGRLTIRARRASAWDDHSRPGVRVSFLDDGAGITKELMKRIFEPFYTTKKDVGTGLGLWLALGLVKKHHGTLRVRSGIRPGASWTVFSVFLPESIPTDILPSAGDTGSGTKGTLQ